jgi:hypothetical protein
LASMRHSHCGFEPVSAQRQPVSGSLLLQKFGYRKFIEQRLASGFLAFAARRPIWPVHPPQPGTSPTSPEVTPLLGIRKGSPDCRPGYCGG